MWLMMAIPAATVNASSHTPTTGSATRVFETIALRRKKQPKVEPNAAIPPTKPPITAFCRSPLKTAAPHKAPDTIRPINPGLAIRLGAKGSLSPINSPAASTFNTFDVGIV